MRSLSSGLWVLSLHLLASAYLAMPVIIFPYYASEPKIPIYKPTISRFDIVEKMMLERQIDLGAVHPAFRGGAQSAL